MLLTKGFEVEMYTGKTTGEIVGLSDQIVASLDRFVREPDSRNVEYTTAPHCCYERLLCDLLKPRQQLRQFLQTLDPTYTLIPGSTLSLGDTQTFYRSDPQNPYHTYIEETYGTTVVTASIHINVGISEPELLMRACRLIRVEAPLYLALSASSPFLAGKATGHHSTRWHMFPKTPRIVPLFHSHQHYVDWTEEQLALGTMQNVRHLWLSVRPNGDRRPYSLNRLELRICDLVADPIALLAITALLEARLHQLLAQPDLDPLIASQFSMSELVALTDQNELSVAHKSLDATLTHWQTGQSIKAYQWIEDMYGEVQSFAKQKGFLCFLSPLRKILREGNVAQQWLKQLEHNDCHIVLSQAIRSMQQEEAELADKLLCQSLAA